MTNSRFSRQPLGARLFSFAVVADTHVNESEDTCASPFATNARANARARHVFADIANLDPAPAFTIHLGDIVHPVPSMPSFEVAADRFKAIAGQIDMPLHLVPGNHDVGDKRIDWMPADIVCDDYLDKYRQVFGPDYYAVDHGGVRFLFLNALLFNSGLAADDAQRAWIDEQLAGASGRVFVSLHYPPYLHDANERGSYDNIDEPGRGWLLSRLADPRVEGVFAGHVHNFWYDVIGVAEVYMLPSTAFLRHDFSEFYRVPPADEFGRGDVEKFGYFIVDVHEQGHVAKLIRTHGAMRGEAEPGRAAARTLPTVHTKTAACDGIAVEMRHPWAEIVEIPCTGGVQEFGRKLARNDYPLMSMWEMGLRTLKIPVQDLRDDKTLRRARLMSDVGHRFVLTSLGLPDARLLQQAREHGVAIAAIEINLNAQALEEAGAALQRLRAHTDARLVYCKIRTGADDAHFDGKHYSHFVNTGLRASELEAAQSALLPHFAQKNLDGFTVRLDWGADLIATHQQLAAQARDWGATVNVGVKLADRLAAANTDDTAIAALVAEAFLAARTTDAVSYSFDTFMDVDRGYFPRNGLIDRRYDPRPAGLALAALNAVFAGQAAGAGSVERIDGEAGLRLCRYRCGEQTYELAYGPGPALKRQIEAGAFKRVVDLTAQRALQTGDDWAEYARLHLPGHAVLLIQRS
ncbi:metallophosphoesterase [Achromobacter sp. ACM04]|uniref:metallophosphoesterase n=1 Tax=Achromobacter sp. ACM04 TaxID=2769312 RepID=UPI00177F9AB0|nr:metallophosphoesterase [Achromobacter sp. ACM04]MBD9417777.1 metallophosphoesterase [Achromobacter sp. ACM04]